MSTQHKKLRVALINDFEIVVQGLDALLRPYADEVELVPQTQISQGVDIALYDCFAMADRGWSTLTVLSADENVKRIAVFTKSIPQSFVDRMLDMGVTGVLSKALGGEELVRSLRAIDSGEHVVSDSLSIELERGTWPGRRQGLTERESEVVALICQGMPNDIIAVHLHLTLNTLKSYIRTAYRKMGVTTRSEAVLWGVGYGFHMTPPSTPDTSADCLTPRPIESSGNVTNSATPASPAETAR